MRTLCLLVGLAVSAPLIASVGCGGRGSEGAECDEKNDCEEGLDCVANCSDCEFRVKECVKPGDGGGN